MQVTEIISFNGTTFASLDWEPWVMEEQGTWTPTATFEPRQGAPALYTGATIEPRAIPVKFIWRGSSNITTAKNALLGLLDPLAPEPRTLTATMPTSPAVTVTCEAVVQLLPADDENELNTVNVAFLTADPFWHESTTSTATLQLDDANDADTVTNSGATAVSPRITIDNFQGYVLALRDRLRITFTNNAELPLERDTVVLPVPYSIGLGSNVALLKDGTFYPVSALNPSGASEIWCAFPITVDPGESETYDLIGQVNTEGDLGTFTRFDGNYCALDLGMEGHSVTSYSAPTITASGASWVASRWAGASMYVYAGTGAGQKRQIASNTATTLTPTRALTTALDSTSKVVLIGSGWFMDGGTTSSSGVNTITDSSQAWVPGSLEGATLTIGGDERTVTTNTATSLTFTPNISPAPTGTYTLDRPGYHRYYVDQVNHAEDHRGGWQQNKRYTRPSKILWGDDILNAWEPFLLTDNADDFNQARTTPVTIGGSTVHYFPILDADRRRGQDRRLQEEGQADGVAIYHPLGYDAIRFDYQHKNPNGICSFLFAGREAGGDEFEPFVEDATTRVSLTNVSAQNVDLRTYGSPEQLYMGNQPADGVEVSRDAAEGDTSTVRWYQTLRLWLDIRGRYAYSIGTVESVIAIEDEIRIGDYALQIGQRDGQRLYIKTTDSLVLDCATARAWIDHGGGDTTDVTYAVTPVVYDSAGTTRIAEKWPVLAPGSNTVTVTTDVWSLSGGYDAEFVWSEVHYG